MPTKGRGNGFFSGVLWEDVSVAVVYFPNVETNTRIITIIVGIVDI